MQRKLSNASTKVVNQENLLEGVGLGQIVMESIHKRYRFEKTLGEGAFGKVKVASLLANPEKKYAIKSIPRELIQKPKPNSDEDDFDEEQM